MSLTTFARNAMLGAFPGTFLSAHTAYSATGGNELKGGNPAYTRQAVVYASASNEVRTAINVPTFNVPAGSTVRFLGIWDAITGGNLLAMLPNGGDERPFAVSGGAIKAPAHGWAAGQKVALTGGQPPAPLVEGAIYTVVGPTADTFQVADARGNGIKLKGDPGPKCVVAVIVEESFGSQGTLAVSPHSVRLNA